ncbi:MAG: glycosyltransferase family 39 protein [Planctomycetota bacterium]
MTDPSTSTGWRPGQPVRRAGYAESARVPESAPGPDADQAKKTPGALGVWLALLGITLVAAVLRVYHLDHGGLWYDELIMARITAGSWASLWAEIWMGRPPIYPVLGKLWADMFGHSDTAMRGLSATLSLLSVPMLFLVARRLFDAHVALIASAFMAVSPYQVYYAQEHRYYALFLLFSLTSVWLLLRALGVGGRANRQVPSGPKQGGGRPAGLGIWGGYVLISALAFYVHTFMLFLLSSIGIAVLVMYARRSLAIARMRRFLGSQVAIMALILPWGLLKLGLFRSTSEAEAAKEGALAMPWISLPPWWSPIRSVGNFLFLGAKYLSQPWVIAGLLVLVAGVVCGVWHHGKIRRWSQELSQSLRDGLGVRRGAWWIAGMWAFGPLLMVFALSYLVRPIYNDRYLMASTAGLYILLAAVIVMVRRMVPVWATTGMILLCMAGSLVTYYAQPQKGAWAEAAVWLDENLAEGEGLAFSSERDIGRENAQVQDNWFWYAQRGGDRPQVRVHVRGELDALVADLKSVSSPQHGVWLVMWRDPDAPVGLAEQFAQSPIHGLTLEQTQKFFDLTLMRFAWAEPEMGSSDQGEPEI